MPIHDWTRVEAGIFHEFHGDWIFTLKNALNQGVLPPDYYALGEQVAGGLHPDVLTLERRDSSSNSGNGSGAFSGGGGGIALAAQPPRVHISATLATEPYAKKRNRVVIRHVSDHRVVAIVEIVSPGNKASKHAFASFVQKSLELLDAGIHLLILDLLPPGPRDLAICAEYSNEPFEPTYEAAFAAVPRYWRDVLNGV